MSWFALLKVSVSLFSCNAISDDANSASNVDVHG